MNFLGYAHWFMSIIISQSKDHSISVEQARYATSVVAKYLDTATVKASTKFYKITLPAYMIFTKGVVSTKDEKVEKFFLGMLMVWMPNAQGDNHSYCCLLL